MNSPTVTPTVTAIIAPPISIPSPFPVIPPAADNPDYSTQCVSDRTLTLHAKWVTYGNEEEHSSDHRRKRRPAHLARIQIPHHTRRERTY